MPIAPPSSIDSPQAYERAIETLVREVAGDPDRQGLVRAIAEILAYEAAHAVPADRCLTARLAIPAGEFSRRTAIISDIHGNLAGLMEVLADIESQSCDRILCLGDLVEGGPANEEVIATMREREIPCVRGNHDENNDVVLSENATSFLDHLPDRIVEEDVLYVHISPRPINRKINHVVEAWNVFDEHDFRLIFIGHVHVPYIFGKRSDAYGEATRHEFRYNDPFSLASDDRYIVSVGSVGYGRDTVGLLRYAIYDREKETVELRAIEGPVLQWDYAAR